MTDLF